MMTNQNKFTNKPAGSLKTTWEMRTYDVWGNANDGFEVNDSYSHGEIELYAAITRYNADTPHEFKGASLSNLQIKRAFGVKCHIDTDRDGLTIYVERQRDSYPIGQLHCTSHASLSPIRPLKD